MTKGEVEFKENGSHLVVKWYDMSDVHVLMTVHPNGTAATGRLDCITRQAKMKPVCELEYNKKMWAVDKAYMMTDKEGKAVNTFQIFFRGSLKIAVALFAK